MGSSRTVLPVVDGEYLGLIRLHDIYHTGGGVD